MTPDELAFLAAICSDPADDTARLVYADWLDEHDRPERAEFVRGQCAGRLSTIRLMQMVPLEQFMGCQPHQCAFAAEAGRAWATNLSSGTRVVFTRGFVSHLTCTAEDWLAHEAAMYWHPKQNCPCPPTAQPLERVTLTTVPPSERAWQCHTLHGRETHWTHPRWPGVEFNLPSVPVMFLPPGTLQWHPVPPAVVNPEAE